MSASRNKHAGQLYILPQSACIKSTNLVTLACQVRRYLKFAVKKCYEIYPLHFSMISSILLIVIRLMPLNVSFFLNLLHLNKAASKEAALFRQNRLSTPSCVKNRQDKLCKIAPCVPMCSERIIRKIVVREGSCDAAAGNDSEIQHALCRCLYRAPVIRHRLFFWAEYKRGPPGL